MKYSEQAVKLRMAHKINHHVLPQEFCKAAVRVCTSNLLIADLLGVSNNTISQFRTERMKVDSQVSAGQRYGLTMAYNLFIADLLKVALTTKTVLNHLGYHTLGEVTDKASKMSIATPSIAARMFNRYTKEEKRKINNANSAKEAYDAIGGEASGRKYDAVYQMWSNNQRKVKGSLKNIKVKTSPKKLDIVDVSPSFIKQKTQLEETIFAAKSAGAKSVTMADGVKIEF